MQPLKNMAALLFLLVFATPSLAVQISEIRIDQPSGDIDEYFELSGTSSESLDGLTYVTIGDGAGGSGVIETAVDLTGLSIPTNGIFLCAEDNDTGGMPADLIATLSFENSDNVTHFLVSGFTGSVGDDLDTNDDCVLDVLPWSSIVDGVALIEEENPPAGTECHYGAEAGFQVGPDSGFVPGHVYRCQDEWLIGGFTFGTDDSPGTANINCPVKTTRDSWGSLKSRY